MWLRRQKTVNQTSSSKFPFPSFKDIQKLSTEDYKPDPSKPLVFQRVFCPPSNDSPRLNATRLADRSVFPPSSAPDADVAPIHLPGSEKRIVIYFTSLRIVRPTFEDCHAVQSILHGFRVMVDERDVSMDSKFMKELKGIVGVQGDGKLTLPQVFIGGRYVGGAEEIKQLHEIGELKRFVEGLPTTDPGVCEMCGGYRFILCSECSGSRKCYSGKGGFRSCTVCNENGLVRCPSCL